MSAFKHKYIKLIGVVVAGVLLLFVLTNKRYEDRIVRIPSHVWDIVRNQYSEDGSFTNNAGKFNISILCVRSP